ncbi:MAG: D-alanyl-D-alanine carboxypeptidase [Clostridia bacterium]|nr:D-alanyl-D-alanine carboxypeptidase [Clostridia bacterium]
MKQRFSVFFIFLAITFFMSSLLFFSKHKTFAEEKNFLHLESNQAILLDADSKTIVYSHNEKEARPIASMCKIMTLLLCFENIDNGNLSLDETITISKNASNMGGSQVFLEENGEYKVHELIKSIVVASANDSCVALAERLCGNEELFVEKMNERAKQLKMDNTNFVNCTGLPKDGQFSCAIDVSKMFLELISHDDYFKFSKIWTDKFEHPNDRYTEIANTNKLIRFYEGCDSGKTGYTSQAGHCLVASAKRNDMRLVCVVINAPDSKTRFKEVSSMFNYGFSNYTNKLIVDNTSPLEQKFEVVNGKKDQIEICTENPIFLFSKKNQKRNLEVVVKPNGIIKAPIIKNQRLGTISVYEDGVLIKEENIVSLENVDKKSYVDYLDDTILDWNI